MNGYDQLKPYFGRPWCFQNIFGGWCNFFEVNPGVSFYSLTDKTTFLSDLEQKKIVQLEGRKNGLFVTVLVLSL